MSHVDRVILLIVCVFAYALLGAVFWLHLRFVPPPDPQVLFCLLFGPPQWLAYRYEHLSWFIHNTLLLAALGSLAIFSKPLRTVAIPVFIAVWILNGLVVLIAST